MKSRIAQLLPMIRFGIVGLVNTGVDYIIFMLLAWAGVPVVVAQIISYSCGTANSYILNSRWTFSKQQANNTNKGQLLKFIVINLIVLGITSLLLQVLHTETELPLALSKLIATAAGMIINYIGSRYWVFGSPS
ncbi:GtrA family protein [Paenibacillus ottowii]|uniref:GtrA family protein n=1 Tax=Paenibacillus ottowii TaxID=2315729 RepID=A0ABY3AZR6_9BACL|nr:GtrA family protein [Paenibacillus ottowii]NEU27773.1 GtrA family protein [Paenibacillus polymyxa]TQR96887.1 GtrA family protein [Paenibacillus ottowii]